MGRAGPFPPDAPSTTATAVAGARTTAAVTVTAVARAHTTAACPLRE
ncbi:hypothetical protein Ppa06_21770 [Planomonospora parontospora subsp. parontospora]|uniref:Uncharacterized protein n=2 Tax=Planomonospora parontospora TaxID=58119 RepID=A0AA37F4C0_9ACTN|nr:hypothetical protein GCM10010126_26180 [Planomonospora parontospora]GII08379.1 hypothetical protein Ppa06_21770 [Planomonospora parontospora subsp. parontospora]